MKLPLALLVTLSNFTNGDSVVGHKASNKQTDEDILEINVDGTTGFLRGKQLTTIGKNERPFITFRNIPFAKEPVRFMVQLYDIYIYIYIYIYWKGCTRIIRQVSLT